MTDLPPPVKRVRIRQVAICAPDIWPVEQAVTDTLQITAAHRDKPGAPIWMYNGVFPIGNTFLEILQPERDSAPTAKFLAKQGGAAGYMLLLQVDNLSCARARAEAAGVRVVLDMPERDYHHVTAAAVHLHPGDTRGVLTSFDWMADWDSWAWAGEAWPWHQRTGVVTGIAGVEISSTDPAGVGERFATFIGRKLDAAGTLQLDEGYVRFVDGDAGSRDRLTGIDMTAADRSRVGESHEFARTKVRFV